LEIKKMEMRTRKILGMIAKAVGENHADADVDTDIDLSLSKLVATKVITPECADFILELQYGKEHFHLVRSREEIAGVNKDMAVLGGPTFCERHNAVPLLVSNGSGSELIIVVGDMGNFDLEYFQAEFEPIVNLLWEWELPCISDSNIRICHKQAFNRFLKEIEWPVLFEGAKLSSDEG